jgi:hypothetical protein
MDWIIILWPLTCIGCFALGYTLAGRLHDVPTVTPSLNYVALQTELADLRHLKAQLDNPPQHHEHIWPREPDLRKMGWLRYRCMFANCAEVKWVAK